MTPSPKNLPAIAQLDELTGTPCPYGTARRAFAQNALNAASVHLVDIAADARAHTHKVMTEIEVVIEGEGESGSRKDRPVCF